MNHVNGTADWKQICRTAKAQLDTTAYANYHLFINFFSTHKIVKK